MKRLDYLSGFNNEHQTQAVDGALPQGQFSPQKHPLGLYAEQFSTTAFTAPRQSNRRTWCYRIQPSVSQGPARLVADDIAQRFDKIKTAPLGLRAPHEPLRWSPFDQPENHVDFVDGLTTIAANGDAQSQSGLAIHLYYCNQSMASKYFYTADGELLFVPVAGSLELKTELGKLHIKQGEIAVIPRGIKFQADPIEDNGIKAAFGYVAENYGTPLELPERGPVGANGFANERDFLYPVAAYEDNIDEAQVFGKFAGEFYSSQIDHSPLNVVAWVGNSAPYKYALKNFNTMNSVSYDHPDPSIFTVLTSPSDSPGIANLDFVVFPPRWLVAENTFRPPWYHRNMMSEFMGLVLGQYDAKKQGFEPWGMSLHNSMTPHGPDQAVFEAASHTTLQPEKLENTLAFMLESRYPFTPTTLAMQSSKRQEHYDNCWKDIVRKFTPVAKP